MLCFAGSMRVFLAVEGRVLKFVFWEVSTGKSETFDGLGVTWGCEREGLVRMGMRVAGV